MGTLQEAFFFFSGRGLRNARLATGIQNLRTPKFSRKKLKNSSPPGKSFCESEEGVRLPRETADLWGSPGNFRSSPGNFRGSPGNFWGTSGLLFSSTVRELPGKSPKTSGEVRETSGEVRGLSRSSGEPDSLPVTRQMCLQSPPAQAQKYWKAPEEFENLCCRLFLVIFSILTGVWARALGRNFSRFFSRNWGSGVLDPCSWSGVSEA